MIVLVLSCKVLCVRRGDDEARRERRERATLDTALYCVGKFGTVIVLLRS